MYIYTVENVAQALGFLGFSDITFDYAEYNDWHFNGLCEEKSKIGIIFNNYNKEVDYYYKKHPNAIYSICNLVKSATFRNEIKIALSQEALEDTFLPNASTLSTDIADESLVSQELDEDENALLSLDINLNELEEEVTFSAQSESPKIEEFNILLNLDALTSEIPKEQEVFPNIQLNLHLVEEEILYPLITKRTKRKRKLLVK